MTESCRQIQLSGRGLTSIDDLDPLIQPHPDLERILLDGNRFSDLPVLSSAFSALQVVDLSHNLIYTLHHHPFQYLTHLHVLILAHNSIDRIQGLDGLRSLQHLDLSHNSISEIGALSDLIQLRSLDLSFNEIEQIDDLSANVSLEHLNLSSNFIGVLHDVSDLLPSSLRSLDLSSNSIASIQALTFLSGMNSLQTLSCDRNPFIIAAVQHDYNYRSFIAFILPSIATVDGDPLNAIEMQEGQMLFCEEGGGGAALSTDLLQLLDGGNESRLHSYLQSICAISRSREDEDRRENLDQQSSSQLIIIDGDTSTSPIIHDSFEAFRSALRTRNASLSAALESDRHRSSYRWNLKSMAATVIQSHWRRKRIQSVYNEYHRTMRGSPGHGICNIPGHRYACDMKAHLLHALDEIATLKQRLKMYGEEHRATQVLLPTE